MQISIWDKAKNLLGRKQAKEPETPPQNPFNTKAVYDNVGEGTVGGIFAIYDGEKNQGEMGPPRAYVKDFYTLRMRARQLFIESEIVQTVIMRKATWVYGKGLRLKVQPNVQVLDTENIKLDTEKFNKSFEARFEAYASSKLADYNNVTNLYELGKQQYIEKKIAGDMLVVLYVINGLVKVQHIDGMHVQNPIGKVNIDYKDKNVAGYQGNLAFDYIYEPTGNRIRQGVEINERGEHVAYHVRVGINLEYQRIKARDSMGFLRAYLVYGMKTDLDATRGTSSIAVCMENAKKLERYFGAAILSAETRAKFAMFLTHDEHSVEDDGLAASRVKSNIPHFNQPGGAAATDIAIDAKCEKIASDVTMTMPGMMVNLPKGVQPKFADSKQDIQVVEFTACIVDIVCASQNIPVYVAMGKYDGSFSSARMGGKDWEHTFMMDRAEEASYLNPIKDLQMYLWVQAGKIEAPGYLKMLYAGDELGVSAYCSCRWVGDKFPEVDDLKAANALRQLMGTGFEHMPLIEPERAAEIAGSEGDYEHLIMGASASLKFAADNNILDVLTRGETVTDIDNPGEEDKAQPPQKAKKTKNEKEK